MIMHPALLKERTQKDIERSITHFDQEYEMAYFANRKMVLNSRGGVDAVAFGSERHVIDMATRAAISPLALWSRDVKATLFTGIPNELLYHDQGTPNTAVAGTAAEVIMNLINPFGQPAYLPAGFWLPGNGPIGRTAKLVIRGIWTTAAAAGTAIFTTRIGASQSTAATIGGITPTVIPGTPAVLAGGMWEQELDLELQALGTAAAASVIRGLGKHSCTGWAAPNTNQLTATPMTGASANSNGLTAATVDITANNFISWNQNCTALTVTSMQLLQAFIYGNG